MRPLDGRERLRSTLGAILPTRAVMTRPPRTCRSIVSTEFATTSSLASGPARRVPRTVSRPSPRRPPPRRSPVLSTEPGAGRPACAGPASGLGRAREPARPADLVSPGGGAGARLPALAAPAPDDGRGRRGSPSPGFGRARRPSPARSPFDRPAWAAPVRGARPGAGPGSRPGRRGGLAPSAGRAGPAGGERAVPAPPAPARRSPRGSRERSARGGARSFVSEAFARSSEAEVDEGGDAWRAERRDDEQDGGERGALEQEAPACEHLLAADGEALRHVLGTDPDGDGEQHREGDEGRRHAPARHEPGEHVVGVREARGTEEHPAEADVLEGGEALPGHPAPALTDRREPGRDPAPASPVTHALPDAVQ